ncbi:MAG: DUF4398 domain-containing protein [Pseudomonadota bacterium]|nr:MAG: DUF4398 domain-containing protein [Pseudomonadota bacterium]
MKPDHLTWGLPGRVAPAVLISLGLSACAGAPPTAELTRSESAVSQAIEVGARNYAQLDLHAAEQKLEQARAAAKTGDNDKARRLAEQAQVDAELAEAKSLSTKAQRSVAELKESIQLLRKELGLTR